MDDYEFLTAEYIQQKFKLPKIAAKKIEEANRFIHDPNSVIKNFISKNIHNSNIQSKVDQNTETLKAHKFAKRTTTVQEQEDFHPERNLISLKMKKFRPINGSFSQFYGEQLSIDINRGKRMAQKQIAGLSKLNSSRSNNKKVKKKIKYHQNSLSTQIFDPSAVNINLKQSNYLSKLKEIRDNSELLRENSRHLLKKADSVCEVNQISYQKLQDESKRILSGEEKYTFESQINSTFSNSAGHKRWKSRR